MDTGRFIHRMVFSAALLILPLIVYCSEIAGNPVPAVGSADKVEALTPFVSGTADKPPLEEDARVRNFLADMKNKPRPGS